MAELLPTLEGRANALQVEGGRFAVPQDTAGPPPLDPPPPSHPLVGWDPAWEPLMQEEEPNISSNNSESFLGSLPVLPCDAMMDPRPIEEGTSSAAPPASSSIQTPP